MHIDAVTKAGEGTRAKSTLYLEIRLHPDTADAQLISEEFNALL